MFSNYPTPSITKKLEDGNSYQALHNWVSWNKLKNGEKRICEQCGSVKNVDWANVDGQYKKVLKDYIPLCKSCHRAYDDSVRLGWITAKRNFAERKQTMEIMLKKLARCALPTCHKPLELSVNRGSKRKYCCDSHRKYHWKKRHWTQYLSWQRDFVRRKKYLPQGSMANATPVQPNS